MTDWTQVRAVVRDELKRLGYDELAYGWEQVPNGSVRAGVADKQRQCTKHDNNGDLVVEWKICRACGELCATCKECGFDLWQHQPCEESYDEQFCPVEGCTGDVRYAAPGRGHIEGCTFPRNEWLEAQRLLQESGWTTFSELGKEFAAVAAERDEANRRAETALAQANEYESKWRKAETQLRRINDAST